MSRTEKKIASKNLAHFAGFAGRKWSKKRAGNWHSVADWKFPEERPGEAIVSVALETAGVIEKC